MTLASGTKLGRYEIRSKIGEGGMGEVYLARDTKLDRNVALKVLPSEVAANRDRMKRFVREAKSAAMLNHPNIAHIYEIGEDAGVNFIAMEFIHGQTLREVIHQDQTDLPKLLRYLQHIAEGLAKARAAGIIHRDLKPDNIMITGDGHAKILDFGLAKLSEPLQASRRTDEAASQLATAILEQHSTPGVVLGTVGYMSPEQAQGKTIELDHRSDIFSFGCILFETVTKHRAFEGKDAIETLNRIIRDTAPPISNFRPETPNHLQRIVRRCLAKDPEDRYQTMKDVAIELRDLRRELVGSGAIDTTAPSAVSSSLGAAAGREQISSLSTPSTSAEYIVSGIKQHKIASLVVLLIIIFGVVGLAMYLHARNTEVAIDSIAVLPFQNRSTESGADYLSEGLAESLIYRLSQLPNLKVSPTSSVFLYQNKEIDPIKVGKDLGVNAVLSGRITQRGDNLTVSAELIDVRYNKLLWGEQYERKMSELLATQREIAREIVDKLKLRVSGDEKGLVKHYTESNEAYQLYLKGRFYFNKRNEEGMQKALANFQQAIDKDPNFALAYSGLADTYDLLGAPDAGGTMRPNEVFPKAKAAAQKAIELDVSLAEPHVSLAHAIYNYDRDWPAAEREFKRAIELNPNYPLAHHWYALFLVWSGRPDEGLAEIKRAQELDPLSLPINHTMGWLLCDADRTDEGIEQLRKTLELDPTYVVAHHRLALCYERKGSYAEAISEYQKILNLGANALAIGGLGEAYASSGNRSEAEKALAQLQELSKQRFIAPSVFALIYTGLGDKDQAFAWLEKSVAEHELIISRLKVDHRFGPLRSDPRFADLVKRVGT